MKNKSFIIVNLNIFFLIILSFILINFKDVSKKNKKKSYPEILSFDEVLFNSKEKNEIFHFLKTHKKFSKYYLNLKNFNEKNLSRSQILNLSNDKKLLSIYSKVYKNISVEKITKILKNAIEKLKIYFPKLSKFSSIIFFIYSDEDIYIKNNMMIINLNHFLSKSESIVVSKIIYSLTKHFTPINTNENTLLSEMIYYGKRYVITKKTMNKLSYREIFQYTTDQYRFLQKNRNNILKFILKNKLLYTKDEYNKYQFIGKNISFGQNKNFPPRVGRWIGIEILESFLMHNKKTTLKELIYNTDSNYIFLNSRYSF